MTLIGKLFGGLVKIFGAINHFMVAIVLAALVYEMCGRLKGYIKSRSSLNKRYDNLKEQS